MTNQYTGCSCFKGSSLTCKIHGWRNTNSLMADAPKDLLGCKTVEQRAKELEALLTPSDAPAPDMVNSPSHYQSSVPDLQAIDVIDAFGLDFYLGQVVKYCLRHGKKALHPDQALEDLKKAQVYLNWKIKKLEGFNGPISKQ